MKGRVRVGVGTRFAYDGETLTIIEMFPWRFDVSCAFDPVLKHFRRRHGASGNIRITEVLVRSVVVDARDPLPDQLLESWGRLPSGRTVACHITWFGVRPRRMPILSENHIGPS